MGQRISRAKQTIQAAGSEFRMPPTEEQGERLGVVLHVLYLMFNEGYTTSFGPRPVAHRPHGRGDPAHPCGPPIAVRDGEVAGLLALMLLTDARRPARNPVPTRARVTGRPGPSRWDPDLVRRASR